MRIGAQIRLERFYQSLGFRTVSETYIEDGIEHVQMLRPADSAADEKPFYRLSCAILFAIGRKLIYDSLARRSRRARRPPIAAAGADFAL